MYYYFRIKKLLEENLTSKGFELWKNLDSKFTNIWERLTSSSGKYHQKEGGRVPSIAEHTLEMLNAAINTMECFGNIKRTTYGDAILLSVVLHDAVKYGKDGTREHTTRDHDKIIADIVHSNKNVFQILLSSGEIEILEEAVRYHSGRWSTDATDTFHFNQFNVETFFLHFLDMLSTKNLLKLPNMKPGGYNFFITGLPGSGKLAVAKELKKFFPSSVLLNGDEFRNCSSIIIGYSEAERVSNTERIGFVSEKIVESGGISISSIVSPYRYARNNVRENIETVGTFIEIHMNCIVKDVVDIEYEVSTPEITLDASSESTSQMIVKILRYLKERKLLL